MNKRLERIVDLAGRCTHTGDDLVRTYLIEPQQRPYRPGSLRRAGGVPIGVDEQTRPRYEGEFMQHLLTVDLDEVPEVRDSAGLAGFRAIALFISDAMDNEAYMASTTETALVRLTEADLARGEWRGIPVADPTPRTFDLHPVDVPSRAFYDDFSADFDEDSLAPDLVALHEGLMSANRIGAPVIHWSGDTYTKDFILQFSEELVEVNLGDAGTMYVYADIAYSHGH